LILVDSSVWIDYFKGTVTAQTEKLDRSAGPRTSGDRRRILTKVLQGFADETDFNQARKMLTSACGVVVLSATPPFVQLTSLSSVSWCTPGAAGPAWAKSRPDSEGRSGAFLR